MWCNSCEQLKSLYGKDTAEAIRIQYGGSVKPENIVEFISKEHIDGALVGGASLQPAFILKLLEAGSKCLNNQLH